MPAPPPLRDALLAAALAPALLLCAQADGGIEAVGVGDGLVAIAAAAPVAWRSRAPVAMLALAAVGAYAALATFKPADTAAVPAIFILYSLAVDGSRRRTLLAGAAMVPVVVGAIVVFNPAGIVTPESLKNLVAVWLPLAVGAAKRDRRAYLSELHQRLESAERTREEEALRRVGEERLRIAREVHDVVAHSMVAINVQAGVAGHLLDRRPEAARDALTEIRRVSGEALGDLRATLGVLRDHEAPAPVRPAQGLGGLDELAGGLRAAGIDVAIDVRDDGGRHVPSAVEAASYRIVQEALTNVLRHAGASRADVRVEVGSGALDIEVVDDGTAMANGANGSGNGLRGMRERAAAVGGQVAAGRRAEGGWRVRARLPLQA